MLIAASLLIISALFVNSSYSKYTNKYSGTINISIRKPNYTVVFNSNAPAGKEVSGEMNNQPFIYGIAQNLYENNFSIEGYEFARWQMHTDNNCIYFFDMQSVSNLSTTDYSIVNLDAEWNYIATPVITRVDYNTFSYSADSADAYYVSTSNVKPDAGNSEASNIFSLNTWTTALNTNDLSLSANQVYYVWAKDAITGGNVSDNNASIEVRTITRNEATGSTLTTKLESSSGTSFTTTPYYVFDGTAVYATASANSGYHSVILHKDGTQITNETTHTINSNTEFASTVAANSASITINKDGAAWPASGMQVTLYNGNTATSYTATLSSGSTATLNGIPNGTYNVYAGKDSSNKTTLIDSGVDVTINNNNVTGTINYYSLTLATSTGINAVSNGETSTTAAKQYLYITGGTQQSIAIDATVSAGYNWSTWTLTSGTNPSTFTAGEKTQNIVLGAGAVTLTANTTPRLLASESSLKIGDYVNYPVQYNNVNINFKSSSATYHYSATQTGWRVLSNSGGVVKLVSAGIPLSFYKNTSVSSVAPLTTNFLNTAINSTLTYETYHLCGIKDVNGNVITSNLSGQLRSVFINSNTYTTSVQSLTKSDIATAIGKNISDEVTSYTIAGNTNASLFVMSSSSGSSDPYLGYFVAQNKVYKSKNYLWAVSRTSGKLYFTSFEHGIRPVVTLKNTVKTSGENANGVWELVP